MHKTVEEICELSADEIMGWVEYFKTISKEEITVKPREKSLDQQNAEWSAFVHKYKDLKGT